MVWNREWAVPWRRSAKQAACVRLRWSGYCGKLHRRQSGFPDQSIQFLTSGLSRSWALSPGKDRIFSGLPSEETEGKRLFLHNSNWAQTNSKIETDCRGIKGRREEIAILLIQRPKEIEQVVSTLRRKRNTENDWIAPYLLWSRRIELNVRMQSNFQLYAVVIMTEEKQERLIFLNLVKIFRGKLFLQVEIGIPFPGKHGKQISVFPAKYFLAGTLLVASRALARDTWQKREAAMKITGRTVSHNICPENWKFPSKVYNYILCKKERKKDKE